MRPALASGAELKANYAVAGEWPAFEITFESADGNGRNTDYNRGVELVLARLAAMDATLESARISSDLVEKRVAGGGLDPGFTPRDYVLPLPLRGADPAHLRLALGYSGALINSKPGSSGSTTRRLTLGVTVPAPVLSASQLELLTARPVNAPPMFVVGGQDALVRQTVSAIDQHSAGYEIAGLQDLRKELRGLKRLAGRRIFSERSTSDEWAFHSGGRDELQFNIGLDVMPDGSPALRAGVAFSLEPSQSLPDWNVLVPRIARFNAFMRENPDAFLDLAMWHWLGDDRSTDRRPGPIGPEIVRTRSFIFLGARQPAELVDVHQCLRTFDRLLALYRYVQGEAGDAMSSAGGFSAAAPVATLVEELRLEGGVTTKKTGWITATYIERTLDVELRHNELQNRLQEKLKAAGVGIVTLEAKLGQRAIDLVVQAGGELWFYEVKTGTSVRHCLREAIGQLLEYALWPGATLPARLIVVGEGAPTAESEAYLTALNERFPIPLEYEQFELS